MSATRLRHRWRHRHRRRLRRPPDALRAAPSSASAARCSRPAPTSAAPGTGTATRAPAPTRESWVYCFSFYDELQQDWDWAERFPAQPEVLRYLQHVTDRFDLRQGHRVQHPRRSRRVYDEATDRVGGHDRGRPGASRARTSSRRPGRSRCPLDPPFPGLDDVRGRLVPDGRWPKEQVDLARQAGRRSSAPAPPRCRSSRSSPSRPPT